MELGPYVILAAFSLDLIFGDPRWGLHPVRLIGRFISFLEGLLFTPSATPAEARRNGTVLALTIAGSAFSGTALVLWLASLLSPALAAAVSVFLAYTTIAARDLGSSASAVLRYLQAGESGRARKALAMIVGRDTESLDEKEIVRATVETVAENTSDGVIAPLFYLAIGGPALAMAYKAVSTLDSMVGYRNERYLHFGRAAARLDDAANFLPARATAALICLGTALLRTMRVRGWKQFGTAGEARRVVARDGRNHPSPNSGYPEAAAAGALGLRLGGMSTYQGFVSQKPYIGDRRKEFEPDDIARSVRLMYAASVLGAVAAATAAAGMSFFLTKIATML